MTILNSTIMCWLKGLLACWLWVTYAGAMQHQLHVRDPICLCPRLQRVPLNYIMAHRVSRAKLGV